VNHIAAYYNGARGDKLRFQYWEESSKAYKRIAIIVHGLGYHSGLYPYLVKALLQDGYKVYAPDLVCFGESPGEKGKGVSTDNYADDLETFRRFIHEREGMREIVFIAHSLGASILAHYSLRYPQVAFRSVLASPILDKASESLSASIFSRENSWIERLEKDPLFVKGISADLASKTCVFGQAPVNAFASRRFLLLAGESDPFAPFDALKAHFECLEAKDKQFKSFPRMLHDCFTDPRGDQVFDAIIKWLSETQFEYKIT